MQSAEAPAPPDGGMLGALRRPRFARLYVAQAVSQFGDAISWVAVSLVAVDLTSPGRAPAVVAAALTVRVLAYIVVGPVAGVIADRAERRTVLVGTHLGRAVTVGLLFLVTSPWQVYVLLGVTNVLTAIFTPANQATVPLVAGEAHTRGAFALSAATTEVFGIVGPGLAGVLAAVTGSRGLFLVDAATFLVAGLLVTTLGSLRSPAATPDRVTPGADVRDGTIRLWRDAPLRFALLAQLAASVVGALVLTTTVARVEAGLHASSTAFGVVLGAYGLGATVGSIAVGHLRRVRLVSWVVAGTVLAGAAALAVDVASLWWIGVLLAVAGVGMNWVNLPAETLVADRVPSDALGRVYGAHFAWSHLWWALAYPLAGVLAMALPHRAFLSGGLLTLGLFGAVLVSHRHVLRAESGG